MEKKQEIIEFNDQYDIKEYVESGSYGTVYLIEDKNSKVKYALKIFDNNDNTFLNEVYINKKLSEKENPYITKFYKSGEKLNKLSESGEEDRSKYIIMEYAPKNNLFTYLCYNNKGFEERYAKLIFYKILKGEGHNTSDYRNLPSLSAMLTSPRRGELCFWN